MTQGLPLSPAVQANGLVFLSGHTADTSMVDELSFEDEMRQAMSKLQKSLGDLGLGLRNVVSTTCVLSNLEYFNVFNDLYATYFSSPYPARATYGCDLIGGLRFEIQAVASMRDET